jgi:cytochrome c-type biogenesis protein CcmH/NrfG
MNPNTPSNNWSLLQASLFAAFCLALGIAIGFVAHGPNVAHANAPAPVAIATPNAMPPGAMPPAGATAPTAPPISNPNPSPEELKAASKKAAGSLEDQLKKNPRDFKLLVQAGEMYYHHGAFADAASYYKRALDVQDNPLVRNQYASTLYYQGDADGALQQYSKVLAKSPKNEVALFNTGMIRYKAKKDAKGAIEMWQTLLKNYPNHPQKDRVQSLIDQASKQNI